MGLLELLFGKVEREPQAPARPARVSVEKAPLAVHAVCSGTLVPMEELPDPVFASGALGPAVGIEPTEGVIYAPVTGTVTVTTNTLHALGLRSDDGIDILIHAGVDTVNLRGDGFYGFVTDGQHVTAGEPLMTMDLDKIAAAGYSDVAITVVINADEFAGAEVVSSGQVAAGERVMALTR